MPTTFNLSADATFTLSTNNGLPASVVLTKASTDDNQSIDDLVADLNDALAVAGIGDEVVAGSDSGKLTLTSTNVSLKLVSQFGVYVDPNTGVLHPNDGGGRYNLEDTGLNRVLGGPFDDNLYGGTGLDFLYGNGGNDTLWRADGTTLESLAGGLAGDEWKQYARESDKVWYYRASNADDVISVDFVTEPGLLADQHLITRLTNNNGNFTFAAQLSLDFDAVDGDGNLIWDNSLSEVHHTREHNTFETAAELSYPAGEALAANIMFTGFSIYDPTQSKCHVFDFSKDPVAGSLIKILPQSKSFFEVNLYQLKYNGNDEPTLEFLRTVSTDVDLKTTELSLSNLSNTSTLLFSRGINSTELFCRFYASFFIYKLK